jgi:acyl-CoA reductase-like NAD-dependent aldehyde dehydrogenase
LGELADEAGLPPGALNIVTGDVEAGRELTTNSMVDIVSFTGSDANGLALTGSWCDMPGDVGARVIV